jgi:hypothetical protein
MTENVLDREGLGPSHRNFYKAAAALLLAVVVFLSVLLAWRWHQARPTVTPVNERSRVEPVPTPQQQLP